MTKTATVSLHGNVYQVDPALVARRVEPVFDPFDLTRIEVRYQGRPMGAGVPHRIDRHTHPHAAAPTPPPPAPTGIDYLALVEARHAAELARRIDYASLSETDPLTDNGGDEPGGSDGPTEIVSEPDRETGHGADEKAAE